MGENLSEEKVKSFFQEFLELYKAKAQDISEKKKLVLFNSLPAKFELLFDKNMTYCAVVISKSQSTSFTVEDSFEDPMIVVAVANSRKSLYGRDFLYHFQLNSKRFPEWNVQTFARDIINYELARIF